MSERQPWWYSGDDAEDVESSHALADDASPSAAPSLDWMALLAGAQKVVDWATDRVLAPHSEHDDPHEHPECMVCRTLVVAGRFDVPMPWSSPAQSAPTDVSDDGHAEPTGAEPAVDDAIRWIPIVGDGGGQ